MNTVVLDLHDEMLGDEPVMVYTITTSGTQTKGVVDGRLVDLEIPIVGTITKSYYSKKTGKVVANELYNIFSDGTEQLIYRTANILEEKIPEPPVDVLKYLN